MASELISVAIFARQAHCSHRRENAAGGAAFPGISGYGPIKNLAQSREPSAWGLQDAARLTILQLTAEEIARGSSPIRAATTPGRGLRGARWGEAVLMPSNARHKRAGRGAGAEVVDVRARASAGLWPRTCARHGYIIVPPYDDEHHRGQRPAASRCREIADDWSVAGFGGGLLSGIAAREAVAAHAKVFGVEPNWPAIRRKLPHRKIRRMGSRADQPTMPTGLHASVGCQLATSKLCGRHCHQ